MLSPQNKHRTNATTPKGIEYHWKFTDNTFYDVLG